MLGQWQEELLDVLIPHLRTQLREGPPEQWATAGYAAFAADGSRVALARSKSLEARFAPQQRRRQRKPSASAHRAPKRQAAAARRKKATSPQLWLTLLWHVGSGLPWAWRTVRGQ